MDVESKRHPEGEKKTEWTFWNTLPWALCIILFTGFVVFVVLFAIAEGDDCPSNTVITDAATNKTKVFLHIPGILQKAMSLNGERPNLPKLEDDGDVTTQTWLEDFGFSEVEGKEMTGGLFRMNKGESLVYTYAYEEVKLILEGEFHLKDGTDQEIIARAGDLMYFPKGCKVTFNTPHTALGYFVGQRAKNEVTSKPNNDLNPQMQHFSQINKEDLPPLEDVPNENTFLKDFVATSQDDKSKQMTAGLFRLFAGEPLDYTYEYEELKFIIQGEFILEDKSNGKKVVAKAGDLVYFPKGAPMIFTTDTSALGFFVGQRAIGTA